MPRKVERPRSYSLDVAETWAQERPDLQAPDYLFLIYAMRLGRILERWDDRRCRKRFGISGVDMRVLLALRRAGAPYARRPADLFRSVLVTSGAISKQVDRLAALGLVIRRPDPTDSGGQVVQATAKGVALADAALTDLTLNSVASPNRSSLTALERATLVSLCQRVLLDLERHLEEPEEDEAGAENDASALMTRDASALGHSS